MLLVELGTAFYISKEKSERTNGQTRHGIAIVADIKIMILQMSSFCVDERFLVSAVNCCQHFEKDLSPQTAIALFQRATFIPFPIFLTANSKMKCTIIGLLVSLHFRTAIAIYAFDLLVATVNGKLVKVFSSYAVHLLENIRLHATEAGALLVNAALSAGAIKVDTPASFTNQT
jgi:hypothetical protein